MKKLLPPVFLSIVVFIFFGQFILKNLYPIPSDTIVGLYYPFRDLYNKEYPNGIPFKNFLITDPVRQQYPWRYLAVSIEKNFSLPLWNPYSFSGTPLLANHQSAPFYPLNILFFVFSFANAWGILISLQLLLAGFFLYFYLDNLRLDKLACFLGAIAFSFSGFFVSWMEWNTVLHTALWLPLILLSTDKIFFCLKADNSKLQFKNKKFIIWSFVFIFSLISSFFAGHLQTFFYLSLASLIYLIAKWLQYGRMFKFLFVFLIFYILFLILTFIQWFPILQFIFLSARNEDQVFWQNSGWFIPWQNLIQFIVPDFFGNPATLNYWGIWNYGEFAGYIGIIPLVIALFALFFRRDRKTLFFGTLFFLSLIFSLPTIFAKLPFMLHIPFVDTAQPTRLLFISDFSLAVLASFGFDYFLKTKNKKEILYPLGFIAAFLVFLTIFIFLSPTRLISQENLSIAKRNLILPTIIFLITGFFFLILAFYKKINKNFALIIHVIIVGLTAFDLLRFAFKFTPFTNKSYLFPATKTIEFLKNQKVPYRIASADLKILPPNFSTFYKLESIEGYDPLYLRRYAELVAALERGRPDISSPFGFNRMITPHNYSSKIINLLGVKYILSLSDISSKSFVKVFKEGQTRIYENLDVLPRTFFVENIKITANKQDTINAMFISSFNPEDTAIIEKPGILSSSLKWTKGKAEIIEYLENKIIIKTENKGNGFLVLTDSYYPTWKAKVDGRRTKVYLTDYNFRGVIVPAGKHEVIFENFLL